MSTGITPAIRRARPAKDGREALGRWALKTTSVTPAQAKPKKPRGGHAGRAVRGKQPAYTAEQFDDDVRASVIDTARRGCPRDRPERDCGGEVAYYCTSWHQIVVHAAAEPTAEEPHPRPRRTRTLERTICYDCRLSLWQRDRRAFEREHGSYSLEDAEIVVRVTRIDGDDRRESVEQLADTAYAILFTRDRVELATLLGHEPPLFTHRFEQYALLKAVRHALGRHAEASRADSSATPDPALV